MGLLPRVLKLTVGVFVLLALFSLPASRVDRNPGSAFTPSIAWAGGSPDETLKPPTDPPPQEPKRVTALRYGTTPLASTDRSRTRIAAQRWEIFYSVFRIFATRF